MHDAYLLFIYLDLFFQLDRMIDVAVIRTDFIVYDTGLVRVLRSLSKKYSTAAFGWNREGRHSYNIEDLKRDILGKSSCNGSFSLKILKLKAPVREKSFRAYLSLAAFAPIFWIWIFINLAIYKPRTVLACDLDTAVPAYIYKKIFRKKMVFYIFDRYAVTFIPKRFKLLYDFLHNSEEFFSDSSDVLITVGERVLATFNKKPVRCAIISNLPEDFNPGDRQNNKNEIFTIVYGGHIMKGRGLENISIAMKSVANVRLLVYGLVIDKKLLDEIISVPNIKYEGYLTSSDEYYRSIVKANAMIAVYDPNVRSYALTMHNKTYEAMMCGIPIITNLSTELVKNIGFGITVDYDNIDEIRSAIITLRDNPEVRNTLGKNGRRAFIEKYNWSESEKELYRIYDDLLGQTSFTQEQCR